MGLDWLAPERPALEVARDLLGMQLCRSLPDGLELRWPITEVEAYTGPDDLACHAAKGRTGRTEVMFGPPGHWYVYLCYGIHWMANLVTGPEGHPAAVLLRGAGPVAGPGRLTKQFAIAGAQNAQPADPETGLWLEPGASVPEAEVLRGPRVGVDYAGTDWAARPYRLIWRPRWTGKMS
ncbi:MAG: DNA-3-methyladenine glycosylase [Opitutales bacterium]